MVEAKELSLDGKIQSGLPCAQRAQLQSDRNSVDAHVGRVLDSIMNKHRHLHRLQNVYIPNAIHFITVCTYERKTMLGSEIVANVLRKEWANAFRLHGWMIGRYVIMPDHVHFFCAEQVTGALKPLSQFMNLWKEWTAKGIIKAISGRAPFWQRQFFDHVLRSDESYADKWAYVRENPVRAGLVSVWDEWPYQGNIDFDSPLGCNPPRPTCAATGDDAML